MDIKAICFIAGMAVAGTVSAQVQEKDLFTSPLRDLPSLSASFAELRNDHFHSGIDYRTGGVQGKDVLAVDGGYVYRIAVSPAGFGKVLYIRHPSGYSSVYGHLRSFRPDIEEYVTRMQYQQRKYSVSLFPQRDLFTVSKGELIAWSGNTGSSSGPHLHFEIRDSSTEDPVNPLGFDLGLSDRIRPVIEKIIIYPLSRSSSVNKGHSSTTLKAVPLNGSYGVSAGTLPVIYGDTGIGIKCWDNLDNSPNRCGIYSIEMLVDGISMYHFTADRFSFGESKYINSHIDYPARMTASEYIHRLYLQPGNRLTMYDRHLGRGVLRFRDDGEHEIKVFVSDIHGNRSWITFRVISVSQPPVAPEEISCSKVLPYGRASDFTADGIRLHFPAGALYDTLFFSYRAEKKTGAYLSPVHSVHNENVAIHDSYRLSVRPDTIIAGQEEKLCLAQISNRGTPSFAGGDFRYGYVSGEMTRLGDYVVMIDTSPPRITPSFAPGANLTGRRLFTVTILDDFSGIRSYEMLIDGEWALAEYDAKNSLLIYRPDRARIKEGTLHLMELRVIDNRGNTSLLKSEFRW